MRLAFAALPLLFFATLSLPAQTKRIPPSGIEIPDAERKALQDLLARTKTRFLAHPDLAVRWKAVDWALRYHEFFKADEFLKARQILDEQFAQAGLAVHGYKSAIDDSVQPYGLVLPPSYAANAKGKWRLDVWLHGRGETITELNFIHQRLTQRGQFTPPDTIVLHPFGRYCNAFQFAGETDVFEAIADVQKRYRIDPDRLAMRGFSMGGAGAWRLAAHYPGWWAAAAPGAGFVDTEEYLAGKPSLGNPPPWERTLWTMTNAKEYALNLFALPTIAYSGEIDPQKAAADIMAREMARFGVPLTHLIGPKTGHSYHPETREDLDQRFDQLMDRGRNRVPRRVRFATYTTRYDRGYWLRVLELEEHWKRAEVDASITPSALEIRASNVKRLAVEFGPGDCPVAPGERLRVVWNGKPFEGPFVSSERSCAWAAPGESYGLRKRHGLQGPIDDAFFSRFLMVRPAPNAPAGIRQEFEHAIQEWRAIFRGDALVKDEAELTAADFETANVVLWGTPQTSKWIAQLPAPIPFPSEPNRYLAAIYPHPSSGRYVVLNSGVTFREADSLTNAQQTAKLGDWAILESPYRVVESGFFTEDWKAKR